MNWINKMSIHIEMEDDYHSTTYYQGTVNEKHDFLVEIIYSSNMNDHTINAIEWIEKQGNVDFKMSKKLESKAEDKIKDFVMKWLFEKQEEEKND